MRGPALAAAALTALLGCGGPGSPDRLYSQAETYLRKGELKEALATADRAWQRWKSQPESAEYWRFRLLKAEVLVAQGERASALALVSDPLPAIPVLREYAARRLMQLGYIRVFEARHAEAGKLLDEAYAEAAAIGKRKLLAEIELRRGANFVRLADFPSAERSFRAVLDYAAASGDDYFLAAANGNFSFLMLNRSRFDETVRYAEQGLRPARRAGYRRFEAGLLGNMGRAWGSLGDLERAARLMSDARRVYAEIGDARNLQIWTGNLGEIYEALGDNVKAVAAYREALAQARRIGEEYSVCQWLNRLSSVLVATGDIAGAEQANAEDIQISKRLAEERRVQALFESGRIAEARGRLDDAERIYRTVSGRSVEGAQLAYWRSGAQLANLLRRTRRTAEADAQYRRTLAELERTRGAMTRADWRITFQGGVRRFYNDYIDFLMEQRRESDALAVAEASRAQVLGERLGLPLGTSSVVPAERLQQLARDSGATLVSFWLAPQRSFAWIVAPAGIESVTLPPEAEWKLLVETYVAATAGGRDPLDTGNAAGRRLADLLLWPVLPKAPPGSRLVIVPDGVLHMLNFETLPLENPRPHYWIEDVTLAVVPSLTLAAVRPEPAHADSLLLIGDPRPPAEEFPRLPAAAGEVERIRKRLARAEQSVYTGMDAHPPAYLKADPGRFSLIHFAAHATANRESPLDSAVVLSASGGDYKLYARDILNLPLHARLVTLSACRGAGTRLYGGEGLVGFAWAFMHAGAQNVIAGLWEVNDASTAALMDELYGRLAAGDPPAAALRTAKLSLLRSGTVWRRPYYWAPFQIFSRILPFR